MPTSPPDSPQAALFTVRLIWAAMLMGMLVLAVVLTQSFSHPPTPAAATRFAWTSAGLLLVTTPAGYFIRMQTYKRHWQGEIITPRGYRTGNIILFACLEAPAVASLAAGLLGRSFWPYALPAAIAQVLFALNFPTGRPLHPPATPAR